MTNIDILEILKRKIKEQDSIIASCSYIGNKKAEARERTEYIKIKEFVETLIAENKELKDRNKRQQENLKITNKKIAAQRGQLMMLNKAYIPKCKK